MASSVFSDEWEYKLDYADYEKDFINCVNFISKCGSPIMEDLIKVLFPFYVNTYLYLLAAEELDLAQKFSLVHPTVFQVVEGYEQLMQELFMFKIEREAWNHPYFRSFYSGRFKLCFLKTSYELLEGHLVDSRCLALWFILRYKCDIKKMQPGDGYQNKQPYCNPVTSTDLFTKEPFSHTILRPEMTSAVTEFKRKICNRQTIAVPSRKKKYKKMKCSTQGITSQMIDQPGTSSQEMVSPMINQPGTSSQDINGGSGTCRKRSALNAGKTSDKYNLPSRIKIFNCVIEHDGLQVMSAAINDENTKVACGFEDSVIHIYDLGLEGKKKKTYKKADLQKVPSDNPSVTEYMSPARYDLSKVIQIQTDSISGLAYAPSGLLMSCSHDGTVRAFETNNFSKAITFKHNDAVNDIAVSYCDVYFATASSDRTACLWNYDRPIPVETYKHPAAVTIAEFDPGPWPMYLATAAGKKIRIWSAKSNELLYILQTPLARVNTIAFSPDEKYMAYGDNKGTIRIWDITAAKMCSATAAHSKSCYYIAFNKDSTILASSGGDCRIKFWDVKQIRDLDKRTPEVEYHPKALYPYYLRFFGRDFIMSIGNSRD